MKTICKTLLALKIGKSFSGLLKLSGVKTVLRFLLGNFFPDSQCTSVLISFWEV